MGFTIDQKAKKVVFIINPPRCVESFTPDFFTSLVSWCLENCDVYAYCLHDLDINDDGTKKRTHVHVYCEFKACKRVMTNINALADWLGFKTEQISAEVASSNPAGFIQYLIHKNNPEKHQYERKEIISNLPQGELDAILDADAGNCSVEFFIDVVAKANNFPDVLRAIGLDKYTKYHQCINMLWRNKRR